jgi:hypothetical protein
MFFLHPLEDVRDFFTQISNFFRRTTYTEQFRLYVKYIFAFQITQPTRSNSLTSLLLDI